MALRSAHFNPVNLPISEHLNPFAPLNSIAEILVGIFVLVVVFNCNLDKFLALLNEDLFGSTNTSGVGFAKWGLALLLVYAIAQIDEFKPLGTRLLAVTIVAMLINVVTKNPQFFTNIQTAFNSFGGALTNTQGATSNGP